MADEVRASPTELGRVAQVFLDEAQALFDGLRAARDGLPLTAEMIGETPSAVRVELAHTEVEDAAGTAVERLIAVLEQDVDALYQIAFAYRQADQEAADDLSRQYPNIPQ
jgi:hypothetical protein